MDLAEVQNDEAPSSGIEANTWHFFVALSSNVDDITAWNVRSFANIYIYMNIDSSGYMCLETGS